MKKFFYQVYVLSCFFRYSGDCVHTSSEVIQDIYCVIVFCHTAFWVLVIVSPEIFFALGSSVSFRYHCLLMLMILAPVVLASAAFRYLQVFLDL